MNARAFGLANGLVYAAFMALLAWFAAALHDGQGAVEETARYYPGYRATPLGGLIGAFYGMVTGFAMGWVIAWLYNRFRSEQFMLPEGEVESVVTEIWEESEL